MRGPQNPSVSATKNDQISKEGGAWLGVPVPQNPSVSATENDQISKEGGAWLGVPVP